MDLVGLQLHARGNYLPAKIMFVQTLQGMYYINLHISVSPELFG